MDDTTDTDRMIAAQLAAATCTAAGTKTPEGAMAVYEKLLKLVVASKKVKYTPPRKE